MKKSVVILNDELGTMSLGFSKAGYDIRAIYIDFKDTYNCSVCENNWRPIIRDISNICANDIEKGVFTGIDCLAGRIYFSFSSARKREDGIDEVYSYKQIEYVIQAVRPKCLLVQCLGLNKKDEQYSKFCKKLEDRGYYIKEEHIETDIVTGIPVKERGYFLVGSLNKENINFDFFKKIEPKKYDISEFVENKCIIDDWYYRVNPNDLDKIEVITKNSFLCWNRNYYKAEDYVKWNFLKIPLVYLDGRIRKITHTEVARLKGIPDEYFLSKRNKSVLYKKLMGCSNVQLVQELASLICFNEEEKVFRKREIFKGLEFEEIFVSFLNQKGINNALKTVGAATEIDFQYKTKNSIYNFEFRIYNKNLGLKSKISKVCETLFNKEGDKQTINILVIGNIVEEHIKTIIKEQYNVIIWDVENILWLLEEFPSLKSDFMSLLSFSVSEIVPKNPELDIFNHDAKSITKVDLQEQLRRIEPGKEEATKYEQLCVDIVRYLFSDYVQFYKEQKLSNAGLYRFDYCGKIKHGNISEFFDTIQNFFNTKYIIFEFKNYTDEISQKEIYTTEKYLYEKALRKVAIVISRKGADESAKKAMRGSLRELGKLIICLSDEDVNKLINMKNNNEDPADYLEALLDDMLMDLEK